MILCPGFGGYAPMVPSRILMASAHQLGLDLCVMCEEGSHWRQDTHSSTVNFFENEKADVIPGAQGE